MVIQRWQTVFLFLSTLLVVLFMLMPFATVANETTATQLKSTDYTGFLILNSVTAIILFLAIFLYRNLKFQKKVTLIAITMVIAMIVTTFLCLYGPQTAWIGIEISWCVVALPILALVFAIVAHRRMTADQKLLSDSGRIR